MAFRKAKVTPLPKTPANASETAPAPTTAAMEDTPRPLPGSEREDAPTPVLEASLAVPEPLPYRFRVTVSGVAHLAPMAVPFYSGRVLDSRHYYPRDWAAIEAAGLGLVAEEG